MYDVIIVGAGPAGISASLYTVRRNLKTLIIYKEKSALERTSKIENYYGFENGINGVNLYKTGIKQAQNIGAKIIKDEGYIEIEWSCLDWNAPSIEFYKKIGAFQEKGRVYFGYKLNN